MNILFIGAPGSGKGTQAFKLASGRNLRHLSTGDLFRENLEKGTALGKLAKSYIDKGELVPDQVTNDMVRDFVKNTPEKQGLLFDGFPRNLSQAESLNQLMKKLKRRLDRVISFEVSDDTIVERLSGRLWAPKSGRLYHVKNKPPQREGFCDQSGEKLVKREDDKEELIRPRLKVFHENTKPLLHYYDQKGLLESIKAEADPEEIFSSVLQALEDLF